MTVLEQLTLWVENCVCDVERKERRRICDELRQVTIICHGSCWTREAAVEPMEWGDAESRLLSLYDMRPKRGSQRALSDANWIIGDPTLLENAGLGQVMVVTKSLKIESPALTRLPDNLCVRGHLDLRGCSNLEELPKGLLVAGDLYLAGCRSLRTIPACVSVGGSLGGGGLRSLERVHDSVRVTGNIVLGYAKITRIPWQEVNGRLDLQRCQFLQTLPDNLVVRGKLMMKGCVSLESLPVGLVVFGDIDVRECSSLIRVPEDITAHRSIDLEGCNELRAIPEGLHVSHNLDLSRCIKLESLPSNLHVMHKLSMEGCDSLTALGENLRVCGPLNLNYCKSLESLPDNLQAEDHIEMIGCTSLHGLPKSLKHIQGSLTLANCRFLRSLPEHLLIDGDLNLSNCTSLKTLPPGLSVKRRLDMRGCTSLQRLPSCLQTVGKTDLSFCVSLQGIPKDIQLGGSLDLTFCKKLKALPDNFQVFGNLYLLNCESLEELPPNLHVHGNLYLEELKIIGLPDGLIVDGDLAITRCSQLASFPSDLHVQGKVLCEECTSLEFIPDNMNFLDDLLLLKCTGLSVLPANLKVAKDLNLEGCSSLIELPADVEVGHSLVLTGCSRLISIPSRILEWSPMENGEPHTVFLERVGLPLEAQEWLHGTTMPGVRFSVNLTPADNTALHVNQPFSRFASIHAAVRFWVKAAGAADLTLPAIEVHAANLRGVLLFLDKLREAKEFAFTESKRLLAVRVVELLRLLAGAGEEVKMEIIQRMEDSVDACHDKPIWALNQMELVCRLARARGNSDRLRKLGKSVMRLGIVHEHVERKIKTLELVDDVCVYLKFEIELRHRLDLPVSASIMYFPRFIKVSKSELDAAEQDALGVSEEDFEQWLHAWPEWQRQQRVQVAEKLCWPALLEKQGLSQESIPDVDHRNVLGEPIHDPVQLNGCVWSLEDLVRHWVETGLDLNNSSVSLDDMANLTIPM